MATTMLNLKCKIRSLGQANNLTLCQDSPNPIEGEPKPKVKVIGFKDYDLIMEIFSPLVGSNIFILIGLGVSIFLLNNQDIIPNPCNVILQV